MMLKVTMDTAVTNGAIQDGSMMKLIQKLHARIKPEACYYTTLCGQRTMLAFFECEESSSIMVEIAEPLFIGLKAKCELVPVMNAADLQRGFEAWKKSGV